PWTSLTGRAGTGAAAGAARVAGGVAGAVRVGGMAAGGSAVGDAAAGVPVAEEMPGAERLLRSGSLRSRVWTTVGRGAPSAAMTMVARSCRACAWRRLVAILRAASQSVRLAWAAS